MRSGLGAETVAVLDAWIAGAMAAAREAHGAAFDAIWERAPAWRFGLPPGQLHPTAAAAGVWAPSADLAERAFPLILVKLHDAAEEASGASALLEPLAWRAIRDGESPEWLAAAMATALSAPAGASSTARLDHAPFGWWRAGARLPCFVLPPHPDFLKLLANDEAG